MRTFDVVCRACGWRERHHYPRLACPECGGGWLDAAYELTAVRPHWPDLLEEYGASMWRYRDLLPIRQDDNIVTMGEGWTPLLRATNLGLMLGHPNIFIKDERQGPTGSFKDRQAAIAMSALKEAGIKEAVVASTGNVAIAYSAYGARAGIKLWVFVTSSVPQEKMREAAIYGSEVIKVAGTYDEAKQIAAQFAASKNLFLDQGVKGIAAKEAMKTVAFETAEQLGSILAGGDGSRLNPRQNPPWRAPDWYLQAVSGGLGPVGVMKGFAELRQMGIIDKMPKLGCFQTAGCAPMVHGFEQQLQQAPRVANPRTAITTLATGDPGMAYEVLRELIQEHGGLMAAVTDAEAFRALHVAAKLDGLSIEPATAVAFAGLINMIQQRRIRPDELVVLNCSGHTFPVEKHVVGDQFTRDMDMSEHEAPGREEGLMTAVAALDDRVKRIVIVEDNPEASRLIRRILQTQGSYLLEEAVNGLEGLRLIRQTRPNLVILDLMMPGMDGFGVVEALRSDDATREIPIIVVTAKELTAVDRRRLQGKIDGLLQKGSFMDLDLLSDIQEALPES